MIKDAIDISKYNFQLKVIDWDTVFNSGIGAVMIRVGWAGYDGSIIVDPMIDFNIEQACKAGLDVGLYVYSYADSCQSARVAAKQVSDIANRHIGEITYPIAFDIEETAIDCLTKQGKSGLSDNVLAFIDELESQGWYGMLYTYTSFAVSHLDMSKLSNIDLWIADYRGDKRVLDSQIKRGYSMWQYIGDKGKCDGVYGACDRNHVYTNYREVISSKGLNHMQPEKDYMRLYLQEKEKIDNIRKSIDDIVGILG